MQYTVVHSKDPYLLARLATDLQMSGVKVDDWHEYGDPFSQDCFWKYIKKKAKLLNFILMLVLDMIVTVLYSPPATTLKY